MAKRKKPAKKPKPATAGEKIAFSPTLPGTIGGVARLNLSRRIDRAIARAVRKERERCVWCARNFGAMDGAIWAMQEGRLHP